MSWRTFRIVSACLILAQMGIEECACAGSAGPGDSDMVTLEEYGRWRPKFGRSEYGVPATQLLSGAGHSKTTDDHSNRLKRSLDRRQPYPVEVPMNDLVNSDRRYLPDMDQIHVISSAIRVLPKKDGEGRRTSKIMNVSEKDEPTSDVGEGSKGHDPKRDEETTRRKRNEYQWRKPKTQFVTRTERMSPPAPRYQLQVFPPERNEHRYLLDNEVAPYQRRSGSHQRRIIYYATLPEIVRRPATNDWHGPPQPSGPQQPFHQPFHQQPPPTSGVQQPFHQHTTRQALLDTRPTYYPNIRDNEVTRVQSAVIDVTNRDQPSSPSQQPATAILSSSAISSISPKYTIYDAEPPYLRPYYNGGFNYNTNSIATNYRYQNQHHQQQQQQPYGPVYQNRYFEDVRTPPYRLQAPYNQPAYNQPPPFYRPEYVPVETQPTPLPGPSSTTQQSNELSELNLQRAPAANSTSNPEDKSQQSSGGGGSKNNLISRYV